MSGIEVGLIATAVLGSGTQVAGNVMAANAKADATARSGSLKRQQADELMSRQVINERIMRERAEISAGTYAGASGLGESGGGIGGVLQIHADLEESIINTRREAEFKAKMLRAGADIDNDLASDGVSAAWISGAGTVLSGGANIYNIMRPPSSKPTELPKESAG